MPNMYVSIAHDEEKMKEINELPKNFKVSIFGSARIQKEDEYYNEVFNLAKQMGATGYDVITGGGPGVMEAGSAGHCAGDVDEKAASIGLNIKLPFEQNDNPYLEESVMFEHFSPRLDTFMELSNVVVVCRGGIGTCLELFYAWQLCQVKHVQSMPIILVGDMWKGLIKWLKEDIISKGLASPGDLDNLYLVSHPDEVMDIVNAAHEVYKKEGDNYHLNLKNHNLGYDDKKGKLL